MAGTPSSTLGSWPTVTKQLEEPLEQRRPAGAQSRLTTQYAFKDVHQCWYYGVTEYSDQQLYYYRVTMENSTRVPMAMVDAVRATAEMPGVPPAQLAALVDEYWNPTQYWRVYEYLAGSMTILNKVQAPDPGSFDAMGATNDFHTDRELAKKVQNVVLAGQPIPQTPSEDEDEAEDAVGD